MVMQPSQWSVGTSSAKDAKHFLLPVAVIAFLSRGAKSNLVKIKVSELAGPLLYILCFHFPFTVVLIITESLDLSFLLVKLPQNTKNAILNNQI